MSDLPPPGPPPPGGQPPSRPSGPLPPPGSPPSSGASGIGQPPLGDQPRFAAPSPDPLVPVHTGPGARKPWWKGPAGYIAALTAIAAIVVAIVLVATSGKDTTDTRTTDSVQETDRDDTRPSPTDDEGPTPTRRTTTTRRPATTTGSDTSPTSSSKAPSRPSTTARTTTTAPTTSPASTVAPPSRNVPIGGSATVTADGDSVQVTLLDVVDNAPSQQYLPPDAGNKLVAMKLRLVNVGKAPVGVSSSFDATLIDGANQQFDASYLPSAVGPNLGSSRMLPGDVRAGWITWEVPEATVPARLQWKLNFSPGGAEWDLAQPRQDPGAAPAVILPATAFNAPITLRGTDDVPITVTALQLVDNAGSDIPSSDTERLVAVQFTFANAGQAAHSELPETAVTLIDAEGQEYTASFFGTTAGPGFDGEVDLSPGDSRTGFLAFEVPKEAQPIKVQIRLDSGFADEAGEIALA